MENITFQKNQCFYQNRRNICRLSSDRDIQSENDKKNENSMSPNKVPKIHHEIKLSTDL